MNSRFIHHKPKVRQDLMEDLKGIASKKEDLRLENPQQTSRKCCMMGSGHGWQ